MKKIHFAETGLALLIAVMAALLSVVASRISEPFHIGWVLGIAAICAVAYFLLNKRYKKWGTVYYLSLLEASMRDEYGTAFKTLKDKEYQDHRAISLKLSAATADGYDWENQVTAMVMQMQESMNEDDKTTSYAILPNMLFPAALAFGSQMYFPQKIDFVEEDNSDPSRRFTWIFDGIADLNSSCSSTVLKHQEINTDEGIILVSINLGGGPELSGLDNLAVAHKFSYSEDVVVADGKKYAQGECSAHDVLANLVELLSQVQNVKNREEEKSTPVVLAARLPKTISIAFGQAIDALKADRKTSSLWKEIIILNWEYPDLWRIARVHPAQPPLANQADTLSKYGYTLPPL